MQEHKGWRSGFQARALADYLQVQENTVFKWAHDAANGGVFDLLDLFSISKACGKACTRDGLHPSAAANIATVQVLANMFAARRAAGSQDDNCTHDKRFTDYPGVSRKWRAP